MNPYDKKLLTTKLAAGGSLVSVQYSRYVTRTHVASMDRVGWGFLSDLGHWGGFLSLY